MNVETTLCVSFEVEPFQFSIFAIKFYLNSALNFRNISLFIFQRVCIFDESLYGSNSFDIKILSRIHAMMSWYVSMEVYAEPILQTRLYFVIIVWNHTLDNIAMKPWMVGQTFFNLFSGIWNMGYRICNVFVLSLLQLG